MTIADKIKEQKHALESDINSAVMERLKEFEQSTGFQVSGIDFGFMRHHSLDENYSSIVPTGVKVTLDI